VPSHCRFDLRGLASCAGAAHRPWGEWQRFVDLNREARRQCEESARICDAGDLGWLPEPLRTAADRMIARLDHELLMVAAGLCPYTGQPLGDLDPVQGRAER
jgi:hypothetical protein